MRGRATIQGDLLAIVFVLTLALLSAQLSIRLRADTLAYTFGTELGTLQGTPIRPENQNRILAAGLLAGLRHLFPVTVSDKSVWFALRVIQASLSFLVLYGVARHLTGSRMRGIVATALTAYFYFWTTLSHPWESTSDFFDILFVAVMAALALQRRLLLLAGIVMLAAANRESAAFGGVMWAALSMMRSGTTAERVRGIAVGVASNAIEICPPTRSPIMGAEPR